MGNDYLTRISKEVTTSSGEKFTIRKVPIPVMAKATKLMNEHGITPGDKDEAKMAEVAEELCSILLPLCVTKPKISVDGKDGIKVSDVAWDDATDLINLIMEHSGLTEEDAKERENFREQ